MCILLLEQSGLLNLHRWWRACRPPGIEHVFSRVISSIECDHVRLNSDREVIHLTNQ